MRHLLVFALVGVAAGCMEPGPSARSEPGAAVPPASRTTRARPDPAATPRVQPAPQRSRMRAHFYQLHEIEAAILRGDLEAARQGASALAGEAIGGADSMAPPYAERLRGAAKALARAESLDDACRIEAQLLAECARCHEASKVKPALAAPEAPPDDATVVARMARHRWAADRAWDGLVGLSASTWAVGLDVMAATPLPGNGMSDDPAQWERLTRYGRALQAAARRAAAARTINARAHAYGELLVVCTGCHSKLESEW
jgi:hypothetical protein